MAAKGALAIISLNGQRNLLTEITMYLKRSAPKNRLREAQKSRDNRAEIVRALSLGEVTKRDLLKMGIFTVAGTLALKNGLSPFARSAYGAIPVGTPPSPLFGAQRFTQEFRRLPVTPTYPLTSINVNGKTEVVWPTAANQFLNGKQNSWHEEFTAAQNLGFTNPFVNPLTKRGPVEGRPPGPYFAHQRWDEFLPVDGHVLSIGQVGPGLSFHDKFPYAEPNAIWSFGFGGLGTKGSLPPPLTKVRYGSPVLTRIYNSVPVDRAENYGFGRNEFASHNHNAHNGSGSDGAQNAHFFPGQFYDYHWGTCLARHDTINTDAADRRSWGIDEYGEATVPVAGDYRESQHTLWHHDHRFFFTAENVYKGHLGMLNYYGARDRGHELKNDGLNLRLPSGSLLPWGNVDFDVNLIISDFALDQQGQLFFDIFDTDGFLGDRILVNSTYAPVMKVLPRKYRFRLLSAGMSRFICLALSGPTGSAVPIQVIANDGNLLVHPVTVSQLIEQGTAERFDIIVDFSKFRIGDKLHLVNLEEHQDGRGPKGPISLKDALAGKSNDPAVGPVMQFLVSQSVESVDQPGFIWTTQNMNDRSQVPLTLTEQIPLVEPTRTRLLEFGRSGAPFDGCTPDCGGNESMPWTIKVEGQTAHYMNANRVSLLFPKPGDVEHITLKNGGGGWDHPIHLHFEESVTFARTGPLTLGPLEKLARKDVWRLGAAGSVTFQTRFSEFGGAYVTHCHNTVHEDFALLMRYQVLKADNGSGDPFVGVSLTPNPTPDGVTFLTPEILPEGDPRSATFQKVTDNSGGGGGKGKG
ncbi:MULTISPECIES: multicopper oxidase domain-containing protein [Rhodomicrobium]|uniref:multicopper oxidase domain-containing protein n=1 Tax=Rhodomicrobium TaxID=1068 RepID=UPI001FD98FF7|nr:MULTISPECIES: multicopper oxidase domain-containing protein [Rhodomicrobium]